MTDTGTSQDTGSEALTVESAAERIAGLLSDDGDSGEGETQEAQASEEANHTEADEADEESEQSDEDEADAEAEADQPQTVTVKIDGEEVEVTVDELAKGYSRQADYTRKTMALSEDRKALEAEKSTLAQQRESYGAALQRLEEFFSQQDTEDLSELRYTDPAEYAARMADRQVRARQLEAVKAEKKRVSDEEAREEAKSRAEHLRAEHAKLLEALPTWTDEAKAKADKALIAAYAEKHGLAPEEIGSVSDHRLVVTLLKAAKWDALQAKKPAVQAKVDAVKPAKPGAKSAVSKVSDLTRQKQRLAKTGRVQDAAAAIELMLG